MTIHDNLDAAAQAFKHLGQQMGAQPGKVKPLHIEVKVTDMDEYKETLKVLKFCFAHMRADHREMAEKMLEKVYDQ